MVQHCLAHLLPRPPATNLEVSCNQVEADVSRAACTGLVHAAHAVHTAVAAEAADTRCADCAGAGWAGEVAPIVALLCAQPAGNAVWVLLNVKGTCCTELQAHSYILRANLQHDEHPQDEDAAPIGQMRPTARCKCLAEELDSVRSRAASCAHSRAL